MAQPLTYKFSKFRVLLGNGATPEVFTAPCGFNARALNRSKNLTEIDIPDCPDEDAPSWVGRDVRSQTWSITGEGVLAQSAIDTWEAWMIATSSKNVRIELEGGSGTKVYTGAGHLATFNLSGTRGERATVNIEIQGDGALTVA